MISCHRAIPLLSKMLITTQKLENPNSLKFQIAPTEEFEQTFDYGLKDITKLNDLNQVVDWQNSSFYQTSTENLNKT